MGVEFMHFFAFPDPKREIYATSGLKERISKA
jgi:hypothetical protein